MAELPDTSNFYSSLHCGLSREQVARLFGALGWRVSKCSWTDFEVKCPWAELVIEGESTILMHGLVADVLDRPEELGCAPPGGWGVLHCGVLRAG